MRVALPIGTVMPPTDSVLRAHDELLAAKPSGVTHAEDCSICVGRATGGITTTAEENNVPNDDARTFTEAEHEALLTDAVRREVASATEEKDTKIAELANKVDLLEAEKADALAAKETAEQELEDFKATIEHEREVSSRKDARIDAVKEISAVELPESYFSDERVNRWAEMADEAFEALLDDMAEQAITHLDDQQVAEVASLEGEARRKKIAEVIGERKEKASQHGEVPKTGVVTQTAAFGGGKTPTDPSSEGSTLGKWLGARRAPVTN